MEIQRAAASALIDTVRPHLPCVLSNDAPVNKRVAAGLLARILGAAEAALHLAELDRRADLAIIQRSLYEHVVMLAWVTGSDGEQRVARWQADDELNRGKLDREVTELRGAPMLTEENRQRVEAIKAAVGKRSPLPPLTERAEAADHDWRGRFGFAGSANLDASPMYSLRAAYSTLYRFGSAVAHPTLVGLNLVSERTPTHTVVQLEPKTDVGPTFGVALALLGMALYVSSDVLGFPRAHQVSEVFDALPPVRRARG